MMLIVGHPCPVHDSEAICDTYAMRHEELQEYFENDNKTIGCCYFLPDTKPPLKMDVREMLCQHPEIKRNVCAIMLGRLVRNRHGAVSGVALDELMVDPGLPEEYRLPLKRRVLASMSRELIKTPELTATFAVDEDDTDTASIFKSLGWKYFRSAKGQWWFRFEGVCVPAIMEDTDDAI